MAQPKRQQKGLMTISEKLKILDFIKEKKYSRTMVQKLFKLTRWSLSRMMRDEEKLRNNPNQQLRRIRPSFYERVDKAVAEWYHAKMKQNIYVDGPSIKKQASIFAEMFNMPTFEPTHAWLYRWQRKKNTLLKTLEKKKDDAADGNVRATEVEKIEANSAPSQSKYEVDGIQSYPTEDSKMEDIPTLSKAIEALSTFRKFVIYHNMQHKTFEQVDEFFNGSSSTSDKIADEASEEPTDDGNAVENLKSAEDEVESGGDIFELPAAQQRDFEEASNFAKTRDQYEVYGENVAYRLRNCLRNNFEIYTAQHNIDEVLFHLCMGDYKRIRPQWTEQNETVGRSDLEIIQNRDIRNERELTM